MTQDSDDLLALVFSAPIHLAPTQVKQDGDMVITSSESHFESHHLSGHHEETRVTESHVVETHHSSGHHIHAEKHVERGDAFHGNTEHYHFDIDIDDRRNTATSAISGAPSASIRSSLSNQTHEQSYDLPSMETVVQKSESHKEYGHGYGGSDQSDSTVTVISAHVQQTEEAQNAHTIEGGKQTPIAPFRTPVHDAVIEQFKSLHKRESVASSIQQQEEQSHSHDDHPADVPPVKVTHYEFDSDVALSNHSGEVEKLEYQELGFEPLLRMIESEIGQDKAHQRHHEERHHHDMDHHRESLQHHHYGEDRRRESHNHHHESDDEQFTFDNVEYVHEKEDKSHHRHDSKTLVKEIEYEAKHRPEHRGSSHEQRITTTTTTTNKLYDPYAIPVEAHGRDDVSKELMTHVVEPMIREIMQGTALTDNSAHFYEYTPTSHANDHKDNYSYYSRSVYDKDQHHHRDAPILVDTPRRRGTNEQVEIRTQMHSSGHSTLVRNSQQRPNIDIPTNTGAVKQLLQKLERGQFNDEVHEKPHKEINIFESLDDNANYEAEVIPPVPLKETHYHQFHELRYRQPRDLSKTAVNLRQHQEHGEVHRHDPEMCPECRAEHHIGHITEKTQAHAKHTHEKISHEEPDHDEYQRHQSREDGHRHEYRDDHHSHEHRDERSQKLYDDRHLHQHIDSRRHEGHDDRHRHEHHVERRLEGHDGRHRHEHHVERRLEGHDGRHRHEHHVERRLDGHDDRHRHEHHVDHHHEFHDDHRRRERHGDHHHELHDERYRPEYRDDVHLHMQHYHHDDHDRQRDHDQKIHHQVISQHKESDYVYEPSEYSVESVDVNQLTVSELTNVFGGAARLRKPDHVEEHKTHKRTSSIHRIDDVVRTANVGGGIVDTRSEIVSKHSYQPQIKTAGATPAAHKTASAHHYTPSPVQLHSAPATSPKVTPAAAPVTVARMTRSNSDQFNSIRVVRNVRDFVNVYGRKDFDLKQNEVITSPLSPKSPVFPTAQEHKMTSSIQALPRTNVAAAQHQVQQTQKQTVVKTDVRSYPKVDAVVQQHAVTHVSTTRMPTAPAQIPVPAKREMHISTQSHTSPMQLPYYHHEAVVPCCCCSHLMHVQQGQHHHHSPAMVHGSHYVVPMLQYSNVDMHHEAHQHSTEHDMHHQHVGMAHHQHQHDDHTVSDLNTWSSPSTAKV